MTGPEHFREAEHLLSMAHRFTYGDGADPTVGAALAAEGQGHALLALAAATALTAPVCTETEDGSGHATKADYDAWVQVAGGGA
jgi:hypothetical protein